MKIRQGFVSNSSAASFCIYGWCESILETNPELVELDYENAQYDTFLKKLKSIKTKTNIFVEESPPDNEFIIGVGNSATDIDHNMQDGEQWSDYVSPPPSKEDMEELDRIAKILNLPKPQLYSATFWE